MLSVRHLVVFFLFGFLLVMAQPPWPNQQSGGPWSVKEIMNKMSPPPDNPMKGIGGHQCWSGHKVRFTNQAEQIINLNTVQCHSQLCKKSYDETSFTDTYGCVQNHIDMRIGYGDDEDTTFAKKIENKCFKGDYFGTTTICYCDKELCNSSPTTVASVFLLLVSWTFL